MNKGHKDEAARWDATASPEQPADPRLIEDLREANEKLVLAALRAQELMDLAEAAQARTELAMEKLRASERELRDTAEFRERLLGIVGHDLRNPLAAISMGTQFLISQGSFDPESIAKHAAIVLRSVQRMDRMIKQLFEFTRVRLGGGGPLELAPIDLRSLCQHTKEELALTSAVPIELTFQGDTTGSWDGVRLNQALSNLIGNAVDHASAGTAVRVKVHGRQDAVFVEVTNQGRPIPKDLLPALFVPFHRGKSAFKARPGHLGLGLFIAHEAVHAHGGMLSVSSAAGATTFVIRLPRVAACTDPNSNQS